MPACVYTFTLCLLEVDDDEDDDDENEISFCAQNIGSPFDSAFKSGWMKSKRPEYLTTI